METGSFIRQIGQGRYLKRISFYGKKYKIFLFMVLYAVPLGMAVSRHEPWFDEAQAWLLARDLSLVDLVSRYLRYEGSPGLWHYILMMPAKLGFPYILLNIISAALAVTASYLFIRYSPFPVIIKILYPFSFFAFYQYAVIARSYALLPVLLFSIAIIYRNRTQKPLLYALLLVLLANVSLHGLIIAAGLIVAYTFDLIKSYNEMSPLKRYKNLSPLIVFGIMGFLLKLQLQPPGDIVSVANINHDLRLFYPKSVSILCDSLVTNSRVIFADNKALSTLSGAFAKFIITLSLFWFILKKKLLTFLIPATGLSILFTFVYSHVWHQGTLFYTWLFILWLSYGETDSRNTYLAKSVKPVVTLAVVILLSIQVYWSINSFLYDFNHNYSASRETANFIKDKGLEGKKIYATSFHSASILPYFSMNIFCNYNYGRKAAFWFWSQNNSMYKERYIWATWRYNPDYIVLGIKNYSLVSRSGDERSIPEISGYKLIRLFSGALYWKNAPLETDSFALFKRTGQ